MRMRQSPVLALATIVVNRWHDNVAFKFGESDALDASKDSADFIPDLVGSYPNYFLEDETFAQLKGLACGGRRPLQLKQEKGGTP